MKRLLLGSALCLTTFLIRPVKAEPFDESKGYIFYAIANPIRKTIVPPQGAMPFDDYVIALSKASDINFLVDSTNIAASGLVEDFPSSPEAREGKWKPAFFNVMGDWGLSHQLADLRYDNETVLFWKEPELLETAQLIIGAGQHQSAEPLPREFDLHQELDDYAQQSHNWDAETKKAISIQVKLGELPPVLQSQITAMTRRGVLRSHLRRELFLSPDYWKTARVRVIPSQTEGRSFVFVGGQDENAKALPFFRPFSNSLDLLDSRLSMTVFSAVGDTEAPRTDTAIPQPAKVNSFPWQTQGLTGAQLEDEEKLKVKVSLEEKRQPLSELLSKVGQQNGVQLAEAPDARKQSSLVTGRVNQMPLGALMGALARVYGAYWTKESATEYVWHPIPLNPLQSAMLRSGKGDYFTKDATWETLKEKKQQLLEIEQEVADEMGESKTPEGVLVSTLPGDTQEKLKRALSEIASEKIIRSHQAAWQFLTPNAIVRLERRPKSQFNMWQVSVLGADDRMMLMSSSVNGPTPLREDQTLPADENNAFTP